MIQISLESIVLTFEKLSSNIFKSGHLTLKFVHTSFSTDFSIRFPSEVSFPSEVFYWAIEVSSKNRISGLRKNKRIAFSSYCEGYCWYECVVGWMGGYVSGHNVLY